MRKDEVGTIVLGGISSLAGLIIVVFGIWGGEGGMQAPRWVVAAAGGVFVLGGLSVMTRGWPLLSGVLVALLLTVFAALAGWVAFIGEPNFTSTLSLPFLEVSGPGSEQAGRVIFGAVAVLLTGLAAYRWIRLVRDRL